MKIQGSYRSKFVVWKVGLTAHVQIVDGKERRLIRPRPITAQPGILLLFPGHTFELCMN